MGFMDKVMFWKKEPKLDIDTNLDMGLSPPVGNNLGIDTNPGLSSQQMSDPFLDHSYQQRPQQFQQQQFGYPQEQPRIISETPVGMPQQSLQRDSYDKNLEIVSMKLDNLRSALENINQRLINIERLAMDSQRQDRQRPSW